MRYYWLFVLALFSIQVAGETSRAEMSPLQDDGPARELFNVIAKNKVEEKKLMEQRWRLAELGNRARKSWEVDHIVKQERKVVGRLEALRRQSKAARERLRKSPEWPTYRKLMKKLKTYNHSHGEKASTLHVGQCLKLCKAVGDECTKACFVLLFKEVLLRERTKITKLYPRDAQFRSCVRNAYDFVQIRSSINARKARIADTTGTQDISLATRSSPLMSSFARFSEPSSEDAVSSSFEAMEQNSAAKELARDLPALRGEVLLAQRRDSVDEAGEYLDRAVAKEREETLKRREDQRERKLVALERAKEKAEISAERAKLAKRGLGRVTTASLKKAPRDFVESVQAQEVSVDSLPLTADGESHRAELRAFLAEARTWARRCLQGAKSRNPTWVEPLGEPKPRNPLKDKRLIYALTLQESKKVLRQFVKGFRRDQAAYQKNLMTKEDARRELGNSWDDDSEKKGHYMRDGQGPKWWLFQQPLAENLHDPESLRPPFPVPGSKGYE